MRRIAFFSLFLLLLCMSCSNDEDNAVPDMLTEICDVHIDAYGLATKAVLDNGTQLDLSSQGITSDVHDTVLRNVIDYAIVDGQPKVYSSRPAFCTEAMPKEDFSITPHDPVKIISVWKSGKYVNMVLGELTTGVSAHAYGFCIDELRGRTLCVSLLHVQPYGDAESYTRRTYASLPLANSVVSEYDSVAVSIVTYDGVRTFAFAVP